MMTRGEKILSVEEAERAALHERCAQLWESHEALRAEVERLGMQADYWKAKVLPLEAHLAEVEQALRPVVDALTWALGEVRAWADDEVNEADYQRACEANSAARAVLDKGEPDDGPPMDSLSVIRRTVDDWRSALMTDDELIAAICAVLDKGEPSRTCSADSVETVVPKRCPKCGSDDPEAHWTTLLQDGGPTRCPNLWHTEGEQS